MQKKIQERVIQKLNKEIGSDLKNLHKVKYVLQNYKQQYEDIAGSLTFDSKYNSRIKSALASRIHATECVDFEIEKIRQFDKKLANKILECDAVIKEVSPNLKNVQNLQQLIEYMHIIKDIQDINNGLTSALNGKDETKIISLYLSLFGDNDSRNSVVGRLFDVDAVNLKSFAVRTSAYWYELIQERFSNDFEAVLKNIKYGMQGYDMLNLAPSKDNLNKLSMFAEYLFLIKSPVENPDSLVAITPCIVCPSISRVTEILIRPFRNRFHYHFCEPRQTNRLDKPEWYFTQVLNWARETHLFIGQHIQPAAVKSGLVNFNVRLEFIRGLVQLTIEKIATDIDDIFKDENLYKHLLDETLAFEIELRETLLYPVSFPSAISVITQPQYLLEWISIEERFCKDQMDIILQGESPWTLIDPTTMEDLKIPKCADQFVRLLEAVKDRYSPLTQPGHQLQFLNLQLDLIDDFRTRLVQLRSSNDVSIENILNAINYVNSVLREWGENVHYLHLHAALVGPNANEISSVFENSVSEMDHWKEKLLKELTKRMVGDIKAKSMQYRHDNWANMSEQNAKEPFILSTSAGEMFQVMVTSIHNMEKKLSSNLFDNVVRMITAELDYYFLESLVMNSKFSLGGAAQFQFDMTRNLFPLFGQYFIMRRPDLLFKRIHDSCILLTALQGNALLLYQTLKDEGSVELKLNALKDFGVVNLKPDVAVDVLERRRDLRVL